MLSFLGPIGLVQKIVGAVALSAILALSLALFMADRRADKWQGQALKCAEGRKADRLAYQLAQIEAADKNRAEVERIRQALAPPRTARGHVQKVVSATVASEPLPIRPNAP